MQIECCYFFFFNFFNSFKCAVRSVRSFLMQKLTPDRKYTARDVAHYLLSALTRANEHVRLFVWFVCLLSFI